MILSIIFIDTLMITTIHNLAQKWQRYEKDSADILLLYLQKIYIKPFPKCPVWGSCYKYTEVMCFNTALLPDNITITKDIQSLSFSKAKKNPEDDIHKE